MGIIGIFILSVSVALDALAVSFSGALIDREHPGEHALIAGAAFGGFQFIMPLAGFAVGKTATRCAGVACICVICGFSKCIHSHDNRQLFSLRAEPVLPKPFSRTTHHPIT